jgi:hypothetical protein
VTIKVCSSEGTRYLIDHQLDCSVALKHLAKTLLTQWERAVCFFTDGDIFLCSEVISNYPVWITQRGDQNFIPKPRTLAELGIPRSTFYRYRQVGRSGSKPFPFSASSSGTRSRPWSKSVVQVALEHPGKMQSAEL